MNDCHAGRKAGAQNPAYRAASQCLLSLSCIACRHVKYLSCVFLWKIAGNRCGYLSGDVGRQIWECDLRFLILSETGGDVMPVQPNHHADPIASFLNGGRILSIYRQS